MDELQVDGLTIRIEQRDDRARVLWQGVSEAREPGAHISPFLDKVVEDVRGLAVDIDFSAMEYMNSATVAPILRFIRALERECVAITILYDHKKTFQRTMFSAIKALGIVLEKLEVRAV